MGNLTVLATLLFKDYTLIGHIRIFLPQSTPAPKKFHLLIVVISELLIPTRNADTVRTPSGIYYGIDLTLNT